MGERVKRETMCVDNFGSTINNGPQIPKDKPYRMINGALNNNPSATALSDDEIEKLSWHNEEALGPGTDDCEYYYRLIITGNFCFDNICYAIMRPCRCVKSQMGDNVNYSDVLLHVSEKKYILPKQYNYHFAMTRYYNYQFMQIEDFLTIGNINSVFDKREHIDGKVFALYSLETTKEYLGKIEQKLKESSVKNLVVIVARSPFALLKQAMDIDIIREIKSNASFISENEVYGKELIVMEEDLELEISKYIDDNFGKTKKRSIFLLRIYLGYIFQL